MPLVVDASVALAWALPDETSPYADAVLAVVEDVLRSCPSRFKISRRQSRGKKCASTVLRSLGAAIGQEHGALESGTWCKIRRCRTGDSNSGRGDTRRLTRTGARFKDDSERCDGRKVHDGLWAGAGPNGDGRSEMIALAAQSYNCLERDSSGFRHGSFSFVGTIQPAPTGSTAAAADSGPATEPEPSPAAGSTREVVCARILTWAETSSNRGDDSNKF